jgi:DNA polymerase-3 subunit gamma/tau
MAKKKSKRFIIPSFHFLTTSSAPPKLEKSEIATVANSPKKKLSTAKTADQQEKSQVLFQQKPASEPKKPKAPELKQSGRRKSALSLSSLKRNKEEEALLQKKREQEEEVGDLPMDPFSEERFLEVWNEYVAQLHQKGEKILASILKADTPKLKGHIIHLAYPNELMKVELLKVRPKVLRHIRGRLNNFSIDFEIKVNEDNTKRFAYTPQEKYELLREKNEAITLLRKKFNLEL